MILVWQNYSSRGIFGGFAEIVGWSWNLRLSSVGALIAGYGRLNEIAIENATDKCTTVRVTL